MNGIIPLYKPRGLTSFKCISILRHILKMRKIGHSGTLDPDVDGVLPICVGSATKVVRNLMNFGKVYQGTITLGFSTTTEDLAGTIIKKEPLTKPVKESQIKAAMSSLVNPQLVQIPPMYSAVRVNGHHLYEYARKGIQVSRPKRKVRVDYFKALRHSRYKHKKCLQVIYFEIGCGKGTYVRTLATMLGQKLGIPAVMSNLTRVESGNFSIKQTVRFSEIEEAVQQNNYQAFLWPVEHALGNLPEVELSNSQWKRVQNGAFLYSEDFKHSFKKVILKFKHETKALYKWDAKRTCYRPDIMFSNK